MASLRRMGRLAVVGMALLVLWAARPLMADAPPERRVALIIGNGSYESVPSLANPTNDARLVATTLSGLGFDIVGGGPLLNADRRSMENAIREFGRALHGGAVGLFYYSGHGIQVRGSNYLVPTSAAVAQDSDVKYELVDLGFVLDEMANAGNRLNIVILDACRNNPLGNRSVRSVSSGLGQMTAPAGTVISYATQPDNVASDGTGPDSPYTTALVDALRKPGQDIFATFNDVGLQVKQATGGQQQPWLSVSPIEGQFYFSGQPSPAAAPVADADGEFWGNIKTSARAADYRDYLTQFPNGQFIALARHKLADQCEAAVSPGAVDLPLDKIDSAQAIAACQVGTPGGRSSYLLGRALEAGNRLDEAAKAYRQAAEDKNPVAQTTLAAFYANGRGLTQDPQEALHWYHAAAEQGSGQAQAALGGFYENGHGVTKDEAEAARWYRKAAEQGSAQGQVSLGRMYELGRGGLTKDDGESVRWYRKAAEQGNAVAQNALGYAYASGQGIAEDDALAAQWYRKAAEQGYAPAQSNLGWSYQYGRGVSKDDAEAARWYRKAAEQGNKAAKDYLAALSR